MNNDIELDSPVQQSAEAAKNNIKKVSSKLEEGIESTKGYALRAVEATKDAAHRATDKAKEVCQSASQQATKTLETSKKYVRQNPAKVSLGAFAIGVAVGYLIVKANQKESFTSRLRIDDLPDHLNRACNKIKFW